ncbi:integrating conjugative element protein%2C PFL_4704 family [Burkholderia pseudomallei]|uniref:TIGR03749 family integrating conjugative element protein n=1 Tax=Burkholderia pseudomallei TaxID=28450 RepID=UPI0005DC6F2A|nr:TIGR03749 family integrating conjugative element protein [Burkholderia pseudomallei]TPB79296.1 TIGR03749 family integrating conjugative element protein [Burkholderia pseudomallei]CAK0040864.1 integrating conjugative element protein, PFL_4704 family [Burkholderia pseudomallei]CFB52746.1 integrating conjugative element protein%2C PFL_4704 family [Burkholderia pseudomallei]CFD93143.1 integrating conjugative element protein%2C PFL_4704 family [Burkholderia pseudomallei]CFK82870.1 integrating co
MTRHVFRPLGLLAVLAHLAMSPVHAVEVMRWDRLPLAVPLIVGQERVVFIDRDVRVGVPAEIADHLRVQSADGAIYLRASAPIKPSRLQLQDVANGALILLDIAAHAAAPKETPLEPVRIVMERDATGKPVQKQLHDDDANDSSPKAPDTPVPVVLTRYAAQSLYAPLRTVEPVDGIAPIPVDRALPLDSLLPTLPVRASVWAAWRLDDEWVTAVRLTNTSAQHLDLDPRALQGDFMAATFQHPDLGPTGDDTDTTVVYLVTRGHGLPASLLPAIRPIDVHPTTLSTTEGAGDEK